MYFEANIEALKERYPSIAESVLASAGSGVAVVSLPDGMWDVKQDDRLRYAGNPETAAKKSLERLSGTYPKLLLVYGIGLGYHIESFIKIPNKITDEILIVEKSPALFYHALKRMDWTKIIRDERVVLAVGIEINEVSNYLREYFYESKRLIHCRALFTLQDSGFTQEEGDYYVPFARTIESSVSDAGQMLFGSIEDTYRGFMNIIRNLPHGEGVPLFDSLTGAFNGIPGIAVSTGPSLQHSIDWLKQVKNKAVIACTDSALKVLLDNGIQPHFVGCLERVPETRLLFDDLPRLDDTWLVTTPIIWPETYPKYPGPKINMMRPIGQLKWFYPEAKLHFTGSSVSHLLYVLLKELGCSPIMLVGQDLAFDRHSSRTHVDGIHSLLFDVGQKQRSESEGSLDSTQLESHCMVEGNNGTPILTMKWYNEFRKLFAIILKKSPVPCYNVIPRDYGSVITGTTLMDPQDAPSLLGEPLDVIGKIRTQLSLSHTRYGEDYRIYMKDRLDLALLYLKQYQTLSLDVLDAVSLFRQQHNPNYFGESTFVPFLKKMEKVATNFFEDEDGFYAGFFNAQIIDKAFMIILNSEALLAREKDFKKRIEQQIEYVRDFYSTIHSWASRMERFIERNMDTLLVQAQPVSESMSL